MSDADPTPSAHSWTGAYQGPRPAPYGADLYAAPPSAPTPPRRPIVEIADVWTTVLGTVAVLLVGVLATFVWVWLAPRVPVTRDAQGGVSIRGFYPKGFAGADVTYLFVTVAAGVVCAVVAAIVARHRGLAVSVAMGGGGLLSSLMVAWLGRWLTGGPIARWAAGASVGDHHLFIQLQTRPFIVAWPVVALAITFVVALATQDRPLDLPRHAAR